MQFKTYSLDQICIDDSSLASLLIQKAEWMSILTEPDPCKGRGGALIFQ